MKVLIKKLREDAKMPLKKNEGDFCYDLYAATDAQQAVDDDGNIIPDTYWYGTGLAFQLVRDSEMFDDKLPMLLSIDGRPRSSIYKTGLSVCNCVPTVDEPYTGEVRIYFYHLNKACPIYKKGERIIQIKLGFTLPFEFEWSEELNKTIRGDGGFGSTGKN